MRGRKSHGYAREACGAWVAWVAPGCIMCPSFSAVQESLKYGRAKQNKIKTESNVVGRRGGACQCQLSPSIFSLLFFSFRSFQRPSLSL